VPASSVQILGTPASMAYKVDRNCCVQHTATCPEIATCISSVRVRFGWACKIAAPKDGSARNIGAGSARHGIQPVDIIERSPIAYQIPAELNVLMIESSEVSSDAEDEECTKAVLGPRGSIASPLSSQA
jgi:hypothetical protein